MSELFERLVRARGISDSFLRQSYDDCLDPSVLPDYKQAIKRIKQAIKKEEKVLIYGDYDVDGVTASVVMHDGLKLAGVKELEIMLPDRFLDGYGMSKKVVQHAKEAGASLVVTVDCGSGNSKIIEELKKNKVDVIVTDHHECPEELPKAVAVVNPKRKDIAECVENWEKKAEALIDARELAGVGVAFTLIRGLVKEGLIPEGKEKWLLDLVAIGTICDSMVLTGENRRLCYFGLIVLNKTRRLGLREIIRNIKVNKVNSEVVGFQIGPRLNAAGRMESAKKALGLLMATSRPEAAKLAGELEVLNEERKKQQKLAVKDIRERGLDDEPVIVAVGGWHEGILGIVAGRLVEDCKRPAFVFTEKDGILKGSGRSFGDFNLAEALEICREDIIDGGGHAGACGVKVEKDKIEDFKRKVNEYYRDLALYDQERYLEDEDDLELSYLSDLNLDFMEEMERLEPFGVGNEVPVFLLRDMDVVEARKMGADEQHIRLLVKDRDGGLMKLIAFNVPKKWFEIEPGAKVDIWAHIEVNDWNGLRSVEGRILKMILAREEYF